MAKVIAKEKKIVEININLTEEEGQNLSDLLSNGVSYETLNTLCLDDLATELEQKFPTSVTLYFDKKADI